MSLRFLLFIGFSIIPLLTNGQCSIGSCFDIDCGELNVGFDPNGGPLFCEGEIISFTNTSDDGFDFFIIDWSDGTIDTVFDYSSPTHVYTIPEEDLCDGPTTGFSICFKGVRQCSEGGSCQSGSYDFGIRFRPLANFDVAPQICISDISAFTNTSCNGISYQWNFGDGQSSDEENPSHQYNSPGPYTITLSVTNDCGTDTFSQSVEVVGEPEAGIFLVGDDIGCAPHTVGFDDNSNQGSSTNWEISPFDTLLWCFTDTSMNVNTDDIELLFKAPGIYTVTQVASNVCGDDEESIEIEVLEEAIISIEDQEEGCDQLTVTEADLMLTTSGAIGAIEWQIIENGSTMNLGENFPTTTFTANATVCAISMAPCGEVSDCTDIEIISSEMIVFGNNPVEACQFGPTVQLNAEPPGGTWSGTGITEDGEVTPSELLSGPATFTYTIGLGTACADSEDYDLNIIASAEAFITPVIFCEDSEAMDLQADPTGGVWDGTGVTDSNAGTFDPAISGVGEFDITYDLTDDNGCPVQATTMILVEAFPSLSLLDSITLCIIDEDINLADQFAYSANPSGGTTTWIGDNVTTDGIFNSNSPELQADVYPITVRYERNACRVEETVYINLLDQPELVLGPIDTTVCISVGTLQATTNLQPGTWTGPNNAINPVTGEIDLSLLGDGIFSFNYNFGAIPSCSRVGTIMVRVIDPGENIDPGEDVRFCDGEFSTYTLSGFSPSGGIWDGPALLNTSTGEIDISQLALDTDHLYTYCIDSDQVVDCSACATISLRIDSNPVASFEFDGTPCVGETFTFVNTSTNFTEGSCKWDFGNGQTSMACSPTFSYTQEGTYTVTLMVTNPTGCVDMISEELFITTPPFAAFDLTSNEGCAPFLVEVSQNNSSGVDITQSWCIAGDTILGPTLDNIFLDDITQDSIFTIQLKVNNLCGEVIDEEQVLVHPYPRVAFGINVDEGCSPLTIDFANTTLGNPENFIWDLGLGGALITDSIPPDQVYTTPEDSVSVYTVTLIATNECGVDTLSKDITVYPPNINAFIELDTLEGCQPFIIQPESFSTPGANISWEVYDELGNELSSQEQAPIFELSNVGRHTIILFAENCGIDSDTAYVDVLPAPEVSFVHPPFVCLGETISFSNTSVDISGVLWDFGDGQTSDIYDADHIYNMDSTYIVTLTGFSTLNNCPASFSSEVEVVGLPEASFSASILEGCAPLTIDFSNSSSGQGELDYEWNFGDSTAAVFIENPSHTFDQPGDYVVTLYVRDEFGCYADTSLVNVFVYDFPVSNFSFTSQDYCHRYDSLHLINNSIDAVSFEWIFDGQSYNTQNLSLLPDNPGTFEIQLIAINSNQCVNISSQTVTILPSPLAQATVDTTAGCQDFLATFSNNSLYSEQYFWDFGNGNTSADQDASHLYQAPGTFNAFLRASHSNGCPDDTAQITITVHPRPTAAFSFDQPQFCGAPATVSFINESIFNDDNDWDFGNGMISDETNPVRTFVDIGSYPIQLNVRTIFGCQDSTTQLLDVYGSPMANFTLPRLDFCQGETISPLNNSLEALTYRWEIEGLGVLTDENPNFSLLDPGQYEIKLVAIYNELCQDSTTQIITIHRQPTADFDVIVDSLVNIIGDVQFINLSQQADHFLWDLGDGTITDDFAPFHEYDINRPIQVTLTAFNDNGGAYSCVDSITKTIEPELIRTFFAPNAFAPEYGEGLETVFKPVGIGLIEYEIFVFSPWGEQVWYSNAIEDQQPKEAWDGFYEGSIVPQGAYSWMARLTFLDNTSRIAKGSVMVIR